jgi:hypothetical protein
LRRTTTGNWGSRRVNMTGLALAGEPMLKLKDMVGELEPFWIRGFPSIGEYGI